MTSEMQYELNRTYMVLSGDEIEASEDYRQKMLLSNSIEGTLPLQIRNINGQRQYYLDISEKESVLNYFSTQIVSRGDICNLFKAILLVTIELSKYLLEEGNVVLKPEMIFRNVRTGVYEFVCVPITEEVSCGRENLKSLLQFLMGRLDESDTALVSSVYGLYDMIEFSNPRFATLYETLIAGINEIPECTDEQDDAMTESEANEEYMRVDYAPPKNKRYIPSFREIIVALIGLAGIFMICFELYGQMLPT